MTKGTLHLLPAWLSQDAPAEAVVPAAALERIRSLTAFIAEDAKSARAWLRACGHPLPLRQISIEPLNEHTPLGAIESLLDPIESGRHVGLLSEAGLPAIADPGAALVSAAHARGIRVVPYVGPSSILLALMASGLEGQRFRFVGYLPAESAARRAAIVELERHSAKHRETQVFIETPYRNDAMLADLVQACRPSTRVSVAVELTSPREWIRTDRIDAWHMRPATIGKRTAIFLLEA
ncbi:MAG TPA: SAM-dependent methyltransferase [Usitatibacter sp.]|nr:SAM-dependent methyltransferase [Usitatibacter sp.]